MKFHPAFLNRITALEEMIWQEEETNAENIAQYRSEVAMFGDGGPGSHPSLIDYSGLNANKLELATLNQSAGGKALAVIAEYADDLSRAYYNSGDDACGF